jgi:N-acetylglutamate synthase-like GNAT family acetyltransferase
MTLNIVRRPAGADCASIIVDLPEWFGLPEMNAAYAERADGDQTWVAERGGDTIGVMTLADPGFSAIEIHFLAVRRRAHRQAVGTALVMKAFAEARGLGRSYLTVKTLGPSRASEPYARTRAFYRAVGFEPLEEFTTVWPNAPCLLMAMAVPPSRHA